MSSSLLLRNYHPPNRFFLRSPTLPRFSSFLNEKQLRSPLFGREVFPCAAATRLLHFPPPPPPLFLNQILLLPLGSSVATQALSLSHWTAPTWLRSCLLFFTLIAIGCRTPSPPFSSRLDHVWLDEWLCPLRPLAWL